MSRRTRADLGAMWAALAALVGVACGPTGNGDDSASGTHGGTSNAGSSDGGNSEAGSGDSASATGGGSATGGMSGTSGASGTSAASTTGMMNGCATPLGDPALPCASETPYTFDSGGMPSGWLQCDSGLLHRTEAVACDLPPGNCTETGDECMTDADCTDAPNGRCNQLQICGCNYACQTDDDCGDGQACLCQGAFSACIPADCHTDADCDAGQACTYDDSDPSCTIFGSGRLACTTTADSCRKNGDCDVGQVCTKVETDGCGFRCGIDPGSCETAGRPFFVDGTARLAPCVGGQSWHAPVELPSAAIAALRPDLRRAIAETWTNTALAEHASIASFSRFILELLAVAAPPDLVRDAQQALADEIEHAAVSMAIASAYAGERVDPGALEITGAADGSHDLVAVSLAVIAEGCVGETLAAAEVGEAARSACPELAPALTEIAADELRHAALAWRFLKWALRRADADQHRRIEAALRDAIAKERAALQPVPKSPDAETLRRHGVLSAADRISTRRAALREVVLPCARSLLQAGCAERTPTLARS